MAHIHCTNGNQMVRMMRRDPRECADEIICSRSPNQANPRSPHACPRRIVCLPLLLQTFRTRVSGQVQTHSRLRLRSCRARPPFPQTQPLALRGMEPWCVCIRRVGGEGAFAAFAMTDRISPAGPLRMWCAGRPDVRACRSASGGRWDEGRPSPFGRRGGVAVQPDERGFPPQVSGPEKGFPPKGFPPKEFPPKLAQKGSRQKGSRHKFGA